MGLQKLYKHIEEQPPWERPGRRFSAKKTSTDQGPMTTFGKDDPTPSESQFESSDMAGTPTPDLKASPAAASAADAASADTSPGRTSDHAHDKRSTSSSQDSSKPRLSAPAGSKAASVFTEAVNPGSIPNPLEAAGRLAASLSSPHDDQNSASVHGPGLNEAASEQHSGSSRHKQQPLARFLQQHSKLHNSQPPGSTKISQPDTNTSSSLQVPHPEGPRETLSGPEGDDNAAAHELSSFMHRPPEALRPSSPASEAAAAASGVSAAASLASATKPVHNGTDAQSRLPP